MSYEEKIINLKQCVLKMKERDQSVIWKDFLCLFDYVMNLSTADFLNIRFHAGYITGANVLQYYHQYPIPDPDKYAEGIGYKFFTQDLPNGYWVGEPFTPMIKGSLGAFYQGKIINQDINRYQSCISNLYSTGVLDKLEGELVMEIGGGYGGLAHQIGGITKCTYIIMDLPEMLLFSGGFLIVNNPGKKIYVYDKETFTAEFITTGIYEWDYVLLPNYILKELYALKQISLFINMQSFQEMTGIQVNEYIRFARIKLDGVLYSDNMDRHPFNKELISVTELLGEYFNLLPSPSFYDFGKDDPWFYKIYLSSTKGVLSKLRIKFIHWMTKYTLSYDNGVFKCKRDITLLGRLIVFGLKVLRVVFKL